MTLCPTAVKAGVPPYTIPDRESVVVSVGSIDPADAKAKPVNDASSELVEPVDHQQD